MTQLFLTKTAQRTQKRHMSLIDETAVAEILPHTDHFVFFPHN